MARLKRRLIRLYPRVWLPPSKQDEVGARDMAEDSSSQKIDLNSVAAIVRSYVAKNSVAVDQLGALIAMVHRTLSGLGENAPGALPDPLTPAVPIRRSVQPDHVVCLECGFRAVTLRRHLRVVHGLEFGGLSRALEARDGSPADRTGLFGAPLDDGKTAWTRPQAGRGRNTGTGTGATGPPAAGGYGVGRDEIVTRRRFGNRPTPVRAGAYV